MPALYLEAVDMVPDNEVGADAQVGVSYHSVLHSIWAVRVLLYVADYATATASLHMT